MSLETTTETGETSSEEETSSSSHKTPLEIPRVLTRNLIPSLTFGLDASDMLECYTLVRSAPLHGIANSTIMIQKQALGIRFRPKQDVATLNIKRPMELTLEFGPQRVGQDLNDEAMPIAQIDESSSYLSWDNVGKVYYSKAIVKQHYLSSYYMASMTGAVFSKLLTEAINFAERRRVYQPFSIYSEERGREVRSSSSSDFTWYIWTRLARLGVEIAPILPPPTYEARLWTKSLTKVVPDPFVAQNAATFYHKLYSCLNAIGTNDYGIFGDEKSLAPTNTPAPTPSSDNEVRGRRRRVEDNSGGQANSLGEMESTSKGEGQEQQSGENDPDNDDSSNSIPTMNDATKVPPSISPPPSVAPTNPVSPYPTEYESEEPTIEEEDEPQEEGGGIPAEPAKDAEIAKQAADEAQKAADEAKNVAQTEGENKAADAAQAAAHAAHAAADATSKAASKQAMDSLLSGDGSMMSAIAATCFTDPQYGIGTVDANGTVTAEAYLYRDSSFYYKLELVSPYIGVAKINRAMPRATDQSDFGSGGDALDWLLALSLAASLLLLVLLICQQTGKNYVSSLARCQRWFFNPRKYDYEGERASGQSGPLFFFGASGIPPSMGGKRASYSPIRPGESLDAVLEDSVVSAVDDDDAGELALPVIHYQGSNDEEQREIEMQSLSPRFNVLYSSARPGNAVRTPVQRSSSSTNRMVHSASSRSLESFEENEDPDLALESSLPVPKRFFRDPNEVEMPSLKTRSKIAVPVGSNGSIRSRSSSLEDGGYG
ncbi:hypothetical protein IV203_008053 [Nitzschia inconspicua]|uniref:Uncharacterized protein n=1 Tax=Nitzschia inconspicua TaxID=303405 RepID=A0A9K3KZQ1_9STRA|nr:hypothetical protein IV203_008053 [Nitzschia inconspicua]